MNSTAFDPGPGGLVLAYCTYGHVDALFCDSLSWFAFNDRPSIGRGVLRGMMFLRGAYIAGGRSTLVRTYLEQTKADWLLFVDTDVVFKTDDVYALMDTADPEQRPIVAGLYLSSSEEGEEPSGLWFEERDGSEFESVEVASLRAGQVRPLTGCGMGFTLIHRRVLETLRDKRADEDEWPWFGHDSIPSGRNGERFFLGEDLTFCRRARDLGFTLWGAVDVQLGHVKRIRITPGDFIVARTSKEEPRR